jgi:hypothetical protein
MTVLEQNQTTKSSATFRAFLNKSAVSSVPDFRGPTQFFRALLCFAAEILTP